MSEAVDQNVARRPTWFAGLRILAVILLAYTLVLVYPPLRLLHWWGFAPTNGAAIVAMVVTPILLRMSHEWWPSATTRWLSAVALTYLGICFVALQIVLIGEVALQVGLALKWWASVSAVLLAVVTFYGLINAQRLREVRLTLDGGGKAKGRLIQISDVHLGSRSPALLKRIVRRIGPLQGDLLLITGDFIDLKHIDRAMLSPLKELAMPIVFTIGNHERYVDCDAICDRLRSLGVHVLRNSTVALGKFHILGIDDAERKDQVAMHLKSLAIDESRYQVLMYHRPDGFDDAVARGIDLMLCGHTHGGQIVPFNFLVRRVFPRLVGLFSEGSSHLYVSAGTGTWGPVMRVGTVSEYTVIDVE